MSRRLRTTTQSQIALETDRPVSIPTSDHDSLTEFCCDRVLLTEHFMGPKQVFCNFSCLNEEKRKLKFGNALSRIISLINKV